MLLQYFTKHCVCNTALYCAVLLVSNLITGIKFV